MNSIDQMSCKFEKNRGKKQKLEQINQNPTGQTSSKYSKRICPYKQSTLYQKDNSLMGTIMRQSPMVINAIQGWLGNVGRNPNRASSLLHSLNSVCIKKNFCLNTSKHAPLSKKLSSNTLHTIESLVDIRSWCSCEIERRQYYMEELLVRLIKRMYRNYIRV